MKLYHGTNMSFDEIDLNKCRPYRDFGRGFYLTTIHTQANNMAVRRCEQTGEGTPTVLTYMFNETKLTDGSLKVKHFRTTTEEWADFVFKCRSSIMPIHDYDVVIGPVADDGVVLQMNLYRMRLITIEQLTQALRYKKINSQYCFLTKQAIDTLRRV